MVGDKTNPLVALAAIGTEIAEMNFFDPARLKQLLFDVKLLVAGSYPIDLNNREAKLVLLEMEISRLETEAHRLEEERSLDFPVYKDNLLVLLLMLMLLYSNGGFDGIREQLGSRLDWFSLSYRRA